jgi:hypothetical protein
MFKNAGREWRPRGDPEDVRVHDFLIKELGRAAPYGLYDLAANTGWVAAGVDNDTAAFAVQTIRNWWREVARFERRQRSRIMTRRFLPENRNVLRDAQRLAPPMRWTPASSHPPALTFSIAPWTELAHLANFAFAFAHHP